MSSNGAPYARIECNLSPAGVRDAVRNGNWTGDTATHYLERDGELWDRFFELEPEIEYETEQYGDVVAAGAVLVIGRPIEVVIEHSSRSSVDVGLWDFVETWRKPTKEIVLGDTSASKKFDTYMTASELLEVETRLRTVALAESDEAFNNLIGSWRRWIAESGVKSVAETIKSGEAIDNHFVEYTQRKILSNALDTLKASYESYLTSPNDDARRAELMERFAMSSVIIGEISTGAAQAASKQQEVEQAAEWIAINGSTRLRKAVELGLLQKSMGAYRDERLSLERPGWTWVERSDTLKDVVNPGEADLDALLAARRIDVRCQLRFNPQDRSNWIVGWFLNRTVKLKASKPNSPASYAFDEEPF